MKQFTYVPLTHYSSVLLFSTPWKHQKTFRFQTKLQRFPKVWIWTFGWLVHQINSLYEVLKLKRNFRKNEVVTGKTENSLWQINFVLPILFVLTLASDRVVLFRNVAFSILVLSTKKRYSNFLKTNCVFQKICFKVKGTILQI